MAVQNNSHPSANGDDDIGVGNKLNFYPAVDEDYETRRAEQQAESLIPLKEDLAEWIQRLLDIPITTETFLQVLDNGAALCRLAFLIQSKAEEASRDGKYSETIPRLRFRCRENAKSRTWYARDNTANFLRWCRDFGINEGCMFESEDLVCHRQEKPVVVCLLELARLGYRFGLEPPSIVKIEKEIEREESELASQINDDDANEGAADEGGSEIGDDAGSPAVRRKKKEKDGDGETDEHDGDKKEGNADVSESETPDGMNGHANDDTAADAGSEGHKSRATSHVSGLNDNEENGDMDKEGEEEGEEEEEEEGEEKEEDDEEEQEQEEDKEKIEEDEEVEEDGINGTVNGKEEDENGNEEERDLSSESKAGGTRSNSPVKNDSGTTSPSRKSPTSPRSRIDNIKARQLDKKVKHVASEHNVSEYVNQISEGKYCIFGRVVFIRLLKEKHLMVRVGGGWDTLDHYLSHHSPTKILEFKRNDLTKTPNTSPKHDPDTGETAGTNNSSDEKYLVISGKYKRN